jgi:hypothetical protein
VNALICCSIWQPNEWEQNLFHPREDFLVVVKQRRMANPNVEQKPSASQAP